MDDLTQIPPQIMPGTTVKFRRTYADFPASLGWSLSLKLAGAVVLSKAGVPNGYSFDFTLSAADTQTLTPGNYRWEERAALNGEVFVAGFGIITVDPDVGGAGAGALQSFNEKLLASVESVLNARFGVGGVVALDPAEKYQIEGRSIEKIPTRELLDLRARLRRAVRAEANPGRLGPQVRVEFPGVDAENVTPWVGQRL